MDTNSASIVVNNTVMVPLSHYLLGTVIGVIIVGVLSNVISHWLIQRFPNLFKNIFTKLSKKWATRTEKLKMERENRIADLTNNSQLRQFVISLATNKKVSAIWRCICGLFCLFLTLFGYGALHLTISNSNSKWEIIKVGAGLLAVCFWTVVCLTSSFNLFNEANDMVNEVLEAGEKEKQPKAP